MIGPITVWSSPHFELISRVTSSLRSSRSFMMKKSGTVRTSNPKTSRLITINLIVIELPDETFAGGLLTGSLMLFLLSGTVKGTD